MTTDHEQQECCHGYSRGLIQSNHLFKLQNLWFLKIDSTSNTISISPYVCHHKQT